MLRTAIPAAGWLARRDGLPLAAATAIIAGWLGLLWLHAAPLRNLQSFDQPVYLSIAYDLVHLHRFTDGTGWDRPHADQARPPGMARTPLYPAFLAGAALLDAGFDRSLSCFVQRPGDDTCPRRAPLPRAAQFVMTAAVYLMLWRIAARASGSQRIGWWSLGVGLLAAPVLMRSVETLMTETLALFLVTAATAAGVEAAKARHRLPWLLASGAMVGLAALTRPAFVYLLPAAAVVGAILVMCRPRRLRGARFVAAYLIGGAIVLGPWIARNAVVLSRPALTAGYASSVLAQRVAFDLMTGRQYFLAYVCSLPDGNGIGRLLIGPGACDPFQFVMQPDTFYDIGNTSFMQATIQAAGGPDRQLDYLLRHYVLAHPLWHALVSVPMALRGMCIDHYWGLLLGMLCVPLTLRAVRRGDDAVLAATLPGWFMLAFHAAAAVNQDRYNLMLVIPFSLAGGMALEHAWQRWGGAALPRAGAGWGTRRRSQ